MEGKVDTRPPSFTLEEILEVIKNRLPSADGKSFTTREMVMGLEMVPNRRNMLKIGRQIGNLCDEGVLEYAGRKPQKSRTGVWYGQPSYRIKEN